MFWTPMRVLDESKKLLAPLSSVVQPPGDCLGLASKLSPHAHKQLNLLA